MYVPLLLYVSVFTQSDYSSVGLNMTMCFPDAEGNPAPAIVDPNDIFSGLGEGTASIPFFPAAHNINLERAVTFHLYTRRGSSQLHVGKSFSLQGSIFDASLPTRLVTHGYISNEQSYIVKDIKNKYLQVEDCNVIGVDWSRLSCNANYAISKSRTKVVGPYVAKLIDFLVDKANMNLANVHLIGHSLGAHVMGLAGKNVRSGKVARITGLDPAGVLYNINDKRDRLAVGDAEFVDIIHTCGGELAFNEPLGDVDFYPNLGRSPQPGCRNDVFRSCSHDRSWQYFAESIGSDAFKAVPCDRYYNYRSGKCDDLPKVSMGNPCPSSTRGTYYLSTSSSSPYAIG